MQAAKTTALFNTLLRVPIQPNVYQIQRPSGCTPIVGLALPQRHNAVLRSNMEAGSEERTGGGRSSVEGHMWHTGKLQWKVCSLVVALHRVLVWGGGVRVTGTRAAVVRKRLRPARPPDPATPRHAPPHPHNHQSATDRIGAECWER